MKDDHDFLVDAIEKFLEKFETVFDAEWDKTKSSLKITESMNGWPIAKDGTFLNPKVDNEFNNWYSRGDLLVFYRGLKNLLPKRCPHCGGKIED